VITVMLIVLMKRLDEGCQYQHLFTPSDQNENLCIYEMTEKSLTPKQFHDRFVIDFPYR